MNRFLSSILTILCSIILIIEVLVFWNGWFLPEPHYSVNNYRDIITSEIYLSLLKLLIGVIALFFPIFIIILSFNKQGKISIKSVLITFTLAAVFCGLVISINIWQSMQVWEPLIKSTDDLENRTFSKNRGGVFGLQLLYTVRFSIHSTNDAFIGQKIIPVLANYKFKPVDFGIFVQDKEYTSINPPINIDEIYIDNINKTPFDSELGDLDFALINFSNPNQRGSLNFLTDNYKDDGIVRGTLTRYY